METIDSNQEKIAPGQVMAIAAKQLNEDNIPVEAMLASVAKETAMENADIVQVGNTVFLGHKGKGANKSKMVGRAFNVDTGRNFINNILNYLNYLQNKKFTHYASQFKGDTLLPAMRALEKRMADKDSNIAVGRSKDGQYVVFINLGKEPLKVGE
tara:strand:+ start:847 stop:1311 length:465 start_codon:yes stop_codon:yes gene_type:complete